MTAPRALSGPSDLECFLQALFQPGDGLIELRALPSTNRLFVRPGDISPVRRFLANNCEEDLYFGVAARRDATSGTLENCSFIRAIFADLDFKPFTSEADALGALDGFPLDPSMVVHSGGGLHCYWL